MTSSSRLSSHASKAISLARRMISEGNPALSSLLPPPRFDRALIHLTTPNQRMSKCAGAAPLMLQKSLSMQKSFSLSESMDSPRWPSNEILTENQVGVG